MPLLTRWRPAVLAVAVFAASCPAWASPPKSPSAPASATDAPELTRSALDAPLFYQLLIGELELAAGQPGNAYEVILDAARRTRDPVLFRRAIAIALQARAGEQALAASRAWRLAQPESQEAVGTEVQILGALGRMTDIAEPLRALLRLSPAATRPGLISALPRSVARAADRPRAAQALQDALAPNLKDPTLALATQVAIGRGWLAAGDAAQALRWTREAFEKEPSAPGPALLALELMPAQPQAEALVQQHLAAGGDPVIRMAYARALTGAQRLVDAIAQLELATRQQPSQAPAWLMLGALHLELRHFEQADAALKRYVALVEDAAGAPGTAGQDHAGSSEDDGDNGPAQGLAEARLLLARSAEQRGDLAAADAWLARIDDPQRALQVQTRRAALLARQGQLEQAREAIRRVPERKPEDARAKVAAEAAMLRDARQWEAAHAVLEAAAARFPDDGDLLYEQAMMADKLGRADDAERLLRRVLGLQPDSAHAHNALGYALADRGVRLQEARQLITRALELSPGDPFITDSLGWVEFRLGNLEEALRALRRAWAARPDTEIGAHLGEVLWVAGQREEALRIWREARQRDAANETLLETLRRLGVQP